MKRFTTKIMHKGEEKTIAVWLDDETARLLEEYGDEKLKHAYIVEEYKAQLIERSETRRHQSLEKSMEAGFDVMDESTDVEKEAFINIDKEKLRRAFQFLEPQQKWLIVQIFFNNRTRVDVAKEMGVDESAIRCRLKKIYKKIKKFLI